MPKEELFNEINRAFELLEEDDISVRDFIPERDYITVDFPRDDVSMQISDLHRYVYEFAELSCKPERVTSPKFTQIPVDCNEKPILDILESVCLIYKREGEFTMRIVGNPLLVGIAAVRLGLYEKFMPPCSSYHAVEIEYVSPDRRMDEQEEMRQVKAYLFEYSRLAKASLYFTKIADFEEYEWGETTDPNVITIDTVPDYSEGMDLYDKALRADDEEIVFLYFYKIIEFYSQIVTKRTAYETLSLKLDGMKFRSASNKELRSIFSIAEKYRAAQTDRELAQSVLSEVIDIADLFHLLPASIQAKLSKNNHFKINEFDHNAKKDLVQLVINNIGAMLYSTRNSIVHAKSNYRSEGIECAPTDLEQLNYFLREACYRIIVWHSKLPDHIKYDE